MALRDLTFPYDRSRSGRLAPLESIPFDIIHLVAEFSSVKDLVALRDVSKPLRGLLNDRSIWMKLYRRSPYPPFSEPYEWQSTSYLVNVLSRKENFQSRWASPSYCSKRFFTRFMTFGCGATISMLFDRWLVVAEGSDLVFYDSYCTSIHDSAVTLHNVGNDRILRVFSVGRMQKDGIFAFAVLLFKNKFTIARIIMNRGKPTRLQPVWESTPIVAEGWTDLADVRLYHRLLIINIACVVITFQPRQVTLQASDPMCMSTFFFATRTHFVKVIESRRNSNFHCDLECFPIPTALELPQDDFLHPSHRHRISRGLWMRRCTVIQDSSLDPETGEISFSLCGLVSYELSTTLKVVDVCLKPDGCVSLMEFQPTKLPVRSFCIGSTGKDGYGLARTERGQTIAFLLCYSRPGLISFRHTMIDYKFHAGELFALNTFSGVAIFVHPSRNSVVIELADFARGVQPQGDGLTHSALRSPPLQNVGD